MSKRPTVDEKCFNLAELFLSEIAGATEDDIWDLAAAIQQACEDACLAVEGKEEEEEKK